MQNLTAYQQRVVDERDELAGNIDRLDKFIHGEIFRSIPAEEQERLARQLRIMVEYFRVLNERIAYFTGTVVSHAQ
jgi:hypothetical protein